MLNLPLKYFGKEVGTAIIEDDGSITATFDLDKITKKERERLFGNFYDSMHISVEDPADKLREFTVPREVLPPSSVDPLYRP